MSIYEAFTGREGMVLGPVAEIISDPMAVLEAAEAVIAGGRHGPTPWMQRHRQPSSVSSTRFGNAPLYEGRACCYSHLNHLAHRQDLELPYESTCPDCRRVFRVSLGLSARRSGG
jgi:hypothetical protein